MSFDPYKDNPLVAEAKALGINWRWPYLESLGVLPEYVLNLHSVSDALYRLIGPDPARVREALRLQELVERCDAVGFAAPPAPGGDWVVETSASIVAKSPRLGEAVEAALEELGDD